MVVLNKTDAFPQLVPLWVNANYSGNVYATMAGNVTITIAEDLSEYSFLVIRYCVGTVHAGNYNILRKAHNTILVPLEIGAINTRIYLTGYGYTSASNANARFRITDVHTISGLNGSDATMTAIPSTIYGLKIREVY